MVRTPWQDVTQESIHGVLLVVHVELAVMLPHQAVQRGMLESVVIAVGRGAIRCLLRLPAELPPKAPEGEPARSQAAPGSAIVPKFAHLRVPIF
jgi:hypothetical protein